MNPYTAFNTFPHNPAGSRRFQRLILHFAARSLLLLMAGLPGIATSSTSAGVEMTIQHLLDYVNSSELTFVRNGNDYTSVEAAEHMHKKYRHFMEKIRTPEDFIRLCATKSLISGQPYKVITVTGEEVPTGLWLTDELANYRSRDPQP